MRIECTPDECAVIDQVYQALTEVQANFNAVLQGIGRVALYRAGKKVSNISLAPDRRAFLINDPEGN